MRLGPIAVGDGWLGCPATHTRVFAESNDALPVCLTILLQALVFNQVGILL